MGSQYPDLELRCRMNLVKCQRFKTLQTELPKRIYPFCEFESDSLHGLKVMGEQSDLDKATEANEQKPPVEEKIEEAPELVTEPEEEVIKDEVVEEEVIEEEKEAVKEEEAKEEEVQEGMKAQEEIPAVKAVTGFFRDKIRRIDYILVLHDDPSSETDRVKLDYVTNILRSGLEIEIESGQMEVHKHLSFIKIHAPDTVLDEYGNLFAVKRYFVNNRIEFIGSGGIFQKIRSICRFRFWKDKEKEWLKIIRNNYMTPDGYSNYERSLVVYKILRHLPFGDHVDQYGLHRLLSRNIVLAGYALHDGPYFAIPKQTALGANARQFLFYNWTGWQNIFQSQPLNVIHEYFGPKIAFYYTFYEFYNVTLALASIAGVASLLMRYVDVREPDTIKKLICTERKPDMCPECEMKLEPTYGRCYMRPMTDYCDAAAVSVHLDHPYVPFYSMFMMLWAIGFITLWKKKEYVLNWMWEVDGRHSYYRTSTRPEYRLAYRHPRRSTKTGLRYDESGYHKAFRIALPIIHVLVCCVAILPLMDECKHQYDKFADSFRTTKKKPKTRDYLTLAMFQTLYTLLISALEMVHHRFCYSLVDFENHKSCKAFEKALIKKQFELSLTLMYSFMVYYGWTVGRQLLFRSRCQWQYFFPHRTLLLNMKKWIRIPWHVDITLSRTHGPDCKRYCWPFTCLIELSVMLIVTLVLKQVIFRVVFVIYRMVTDYNEARSLNAKVPCWEREYKLKEFNEAMLTRNYMILAVQFSLVSFFAIAFPLAPVVVLVINVWDMRQSARQLLLASRRAVLIRSPGIGAWYNVFVFIAYAAIATNVLTLVYTTKLPLRIHFASINKYNGTILDYILYDPPLMPPHGEYYLMNCTQPIFRRNTLDIPAAYGRYFLAGTSGQPVYNTLGLAYFTLFVLELKLVFFYGVSMVCCGLFIQFALFKPYRQDVEETNSMETKIKNLYAYYRNVASKKLKLYLELLLISILYLAVIKEHIYYGEGR